MEIKAMGEGEEVINLTLEGKGGYGINSVERVV